MKIFKVLFLFALALCLAFLSLYMAEKSKDYYIYMDKFLFSHNANNLLQAFDEKEIVFAALSYYFSTLKDVIFLSVLTSLLIKLNLFRKISDLYIYVIIYYLARFFLVHELTQIRVNLAIAFFFWSFYLLVKRKLRLSIFFFVLSFVTHNTILFLLPIYLTLLFVKNYSLLFKYCFIGLVSFFVLGIFGETLKFDLRSIISFLPSERYTDYIGEKYKFEIPSLLTDVYFYIKLFSLFILYKNRNNSLIIGNKFIFPAAAVFCFTNIFFIFFHASYAIAARLSDLSSTMESLVVVTALHTLIYYNLAKFVTLKRLLFILLLSLLCIKIFISQLYLLDGQ